MHASPIPPLHGRTVHGYVRPGKPLPYHMPRCTENGSRSAREIRMGMLCSENGLLLYGSRVRLVPIVSDEDPSNQTHP